jgi:4-amino-4-deoxy-L-arabinose transferase-like glycosyltransferase
VIDSVAAVVPLSGRAAAVARPRAEALAVAAVLLLAAGLRLWGVGHDLPFSYFGDELHFMKRAMALGTGDLNPHWFHKPGFLMYVLAFCYGLYYLAGRATGAFASTAELGAHFLFEPGSFLLIGRLVVCACGIATVWVVHRLARRAWGSAAAGVSAALVAAVLTPMVDSSQEIKSDVPCALLIALSVLAWLRGREEGEERRRWLVAAALLAGAAMGTHYYGIVLLPTYVIMEVVHASRDVSWRLVLGRAALVAVLFVAGFAVTSPYNLLDPTWPAATWSQVQQALGLHPEPPLEPIVRYDPDTQVSFVPGWRSTAGAAGHFFRVLVDLRAFGPLLILLAGLGLVATLGRRETREVGLLFALPLLFFALGAVTVAAYHAQPRHLNAVFPLLAVLVGPGAMLMARLLRPGRGTVVALGIVALAATPSLFATVRHNVALNRVDSRSVAYHWIVRHVPPGDRILLDDYGPVLNPNPAAGARMQKVLKGLPPGPFTAHQGLRLALVRRFPPADGRDVTELGHQWWLPREKTDAELRSNVVDLDMGNPLVSRVPKTLAEYRAEGIRWVVTNQEARWWYLGNPARGRSFPSFVRFYRELERLRPVRTFDPVSWGGKGPVVWVYDLGKGAKG